MGQIVDRRPRRDLTYNTRFGWLILPILSKNRAPLKARPPPRWCRPRQQSVRNVNPRRKVIVLRAIVLRVIVRKEAGVLADKDHAGRAEGREIAKAEAVRRMLDAKVAVLIEVMTGVAAIAAASKARPKST